MSGRKLQALRNLAERPGTEAEGKVAREMLDKMEGRQGTDAEPPEKITISVKFPDILTHDIVSELVRDMMGQASEALRRAVDEEFARMFQGESTSGRGHE